MNGEPVAILMGAQQHAHISTQIVVAAAGADDECRLIGRVALPGRIEDRRDLAPAFRRHGVLDLS